MTTFKITEDPSSHWMGLLSPKDCQMQEILTGYPAYA